jgi:DNA-binding transcriptional MerR regulator
MWEQRYDALKPHRSEGNTRYYDGQQLRRLLNIVSLRNGDYKISELCTMADKELFDLLEGQIANARQPYEYFITLIVASALEYDEVTFDKIFSSALLRYGLRETYVSILYPVLVRLGLMWSANTLRPAHEHFITALFRQKLSTAIDSIPVAASKEVWMLFLPANEFHETGLLFANFLIRQSGQRVIYLGSDVPFESLKAAVQEVTPTSLLFFLVRKNNAEQDEELISHLSRQFSGQKIFVACEPSRLHETKKMKRVTALHQMEDLETVLK